VTLCQAKAYCGVVILSWHRSDTGIIQKYLPDPLGTRWEKMLCWLRLCFLSLST